MDFPTRMVRPRDLELDFEVLADDAIIGPAIAGGSWADDETELFRAHVGPGDRVVDLGANVGWFAVQAVLAGAEVHAFEPVPAIAALCERNLERAAAFAGRGSYTVHACAAGAEPGTARIAIANANFGDNRVLDGAGERPDDMGRGEEIEIEVARVDDRVQGPARFLKVDTQGSEWLALAGAAELLAKSPRLAMLLELWPYALRGATGEELLDKLVREGFTIGKATAAPYPMEPARILRQIQGRDPVKGGIDLYATRGVPFHVGGPKKRLRALWRSLREG